MTVSVADLCKQADFDPETVDEDELTRFLGIATDTVSKRLRNPFDIGERPVEQAILLYATQLIRGKHAPSGWEQTEFGGQSMTATKEINRLLAPYKKLLLA